MSETFQSVDNARVLVVSLRNARPEVARCCAYEFEDVVLEVDDADLLAPRAHPPEFHSALLKRAARAIERRTPIAITHQPTFIPERIERDYEVLFLMCQRLSDLRVLESISGWRERCQQVVCWVEEMWAASLEARGALVHTRHFDHIFVGCQGTVAPLQEATGIPCTYGLPAVNVERFTPLPEPPERSIDCYWMGRRAPVSHQALYRRMVSGNFHYMFDTVPGQKNLYDAAQHRVHLAGLVKRSRYFVANKAKQNMAFQTGGQDEVGLRFFEGIAGGAVLLGARPECETYSRHFDWPDACIQLNWDSPDFPEVIDALDREPERVAAIHHRNAVEALRRHDSSYRWRDVLHTLGLEPRPQLAEREARLHALADASEVTA